MKNMVRIIFLLMVLLIASKEMLTAQQNAFVPGAVWLDEEGKPINAHGGGLLYYAGVYYWYGEIKRGNTWRVPQQNWEDFRVAAGGISVYSSTDLLHWKNRGLALAPRTGPGSGDLDTGNVIERPKVLYNSLTKKFVMWMHVDTKDYALAHAGVAVSDNPVGPFRYIQGFRPNGNMSRDMTLFEDKDGMAYHIYSSEDNATMHICRLTTDYLQPSITESRVFINQSREAPAMFTSGGKYYLITSGCTGWSPNPAVYAVADHPLGPWIIKENPCTGKGKDSTFGAQSSFVLPVMGKPNGFIFIADQWNKTNLEDSRYVWLPLVVNNGIPRIDWQENWALSFFK